VPADIPINAIVAAGLVCWLRSVLGTRSGDERERPNPFASNAETLKKQPATEPGMAAPALLPGKPADMGAKLDRNMSIEGESAGRGLMEVSRTDRTFDLATFLRGAQDAFIYIIEAFAEGDKTTLKGLLGDSVYAAFENVINERAAKGEKASVEIHSIRKTEVIDAQVRDKMAFITVRFVADETSLVRDSEGQVIFGNPDRVTETIDIWTFGRSVRSRDPVWLVCETREDAADEIPGSTVPGAAS